MKLKSQPRHWVQFTTITVLMALPLLVAYLFMLRQVDSLEQERHSTNLADHLDQWQERLDALLARMRDDTGTAAALLGVVEDQWLLDNTLRWYNNADGQNLLEGAGVLNADGSLRPSRRAALLNREGQPLSDRELADRLKNRPWLRDPWLADYSFLSRALAGKRNLDFFVSPFIFAADRQVLVVASPRRDPDGRLEAMVMLQTSAADLMAQLVGAGGKLEHLWLMDRQGRVGYASSPLARASAERWAASGLDGRESDGVETQEMDGKQVRLSFRALSAGLVVGAVETQELLAMVGRGPVRTFGAAGVISLGLLILAGLAYTAAAMRRESRMVRTDTLRRYAGTISHRVRNDLVTLRGQTELIASGLVDDLSRIQEIMAKDMDSAISDVERTVKELEGLSRGHLELSYDAQAGKDTLYRVNRDPADKEPR